MAISLRQSVTSYPGTVTNSASATFGGVLGGNTSLLLCFIGHAYNSGDARFVVTDNSNNVWKPLIQQRDENFSGTNCQLWYATLVANSGGPTVTATLQNPTQGGVDFGIHIFEYTGFNFQKDTGPGTRDALTALDVCLGISAAGVSGTSITLPAVTNQNANGLIFVGVCDESGTNGLTAGSGFTRETQQATHFSACEDKILSSIGTTVPTVTLSTPTGEWQAIVAVFSDQTAQNGNIDNRIWTTQTKAMADSGLFTSSKSNVF